MGSALRLGFFYAAVFVGTGASLPYMPVWFRTHGLTGSQIGMLLAAPLLARAITGPALAIWADGFVLRRSPVALLLVASGAAYAAIGFTQGFAPWFLLWFIAGSLMSTVTPLTDVLTLKRAGREAFNYGWPRGMGSAAYIVGNVVAGALLARTGADIILIWTVAAAFLASAVAVMLLPPEPVFEMGDVIDRRTRWRGVKDLFRDRTFMLAALSIGLVQATHAFYYGFSALAWRREGISEGMVGLLWGFGVLVEIGFLWFCEPWRQKVGPERLLIYGGVAAVIRWTAFAFSPPLWLLFPLQALHTFTFAATFVGGLKIIERLAPPQTASAAQTISSALSGGILIGLATLASGALYDAVFAKGYLLMTAMALVGLLGAVRLNRLAVRRVQ